MIDAPMPAPKDKRLADVAKVRLENLRLRAALKPFAEAARAFTPYHSELEGQTVEAAFTLAQLREAQSALTTGYSGK